jgi:hypothetical protein
MLEVSIITICIFLILILVFMFVYNINIYKNFMKDSWCESGFIIILLLGLSLTFLSIGTFLDISSNISYIKIAIFFLIILLEFCWVFSITNMKFLSSVILSFIVFFLTIFQTTFLYTEDLKKVNSVNSVNGILCLPFLIFSIYQFYLSEHICMKNNEF